MIGEKERFHGLVLSRIIAASESGVHIMPLRESSRSCYVIDYRNVVMIKYSTNRLTPWQFVVTSDQCAELHALSSQYDVVTLALVCGPDGVVALDWQNVRPALPPSEDRHPAFSIQAKRRKREQYRISGLWPTELVTPDAVFESAWTQRNSTTNDVSEPTV